MNILARGCQFLLVAMAAAMASAAPGSLVYVEGTRPEEYLKIVGITAVAGKTYALISDGPFEGQWLRVGGSIARCQVEEIAKDSVVLTDRRSGRQIIWFTLHLAGPGNADTDDAARRRKDWINSDKNPMYIVPFPLPLELSDRWSKLSPADKSRVIAVYQDFGWNLAVVDPSAKKPQFNWQNIYEGERTAARAQVRIDFEASLNSDQRAMYERTKATYPDPSRPPKTREQMWADEAVRQTEWAKLKETLSPNQRELYYAMISLLPELKRKK